MVDPTPITLKQFEKLVTPERGQLRVGNFVYYRNNNQIYGPCKVLAVDLGDELCNLEIEINRFATFVHLSELAMPDELSRMIIWYYLHKRLIECRPDTINPKRWNLGLHKQVAEIEHNEKEIRLVMLITHRTTKPKSIYLFTRQAPDPVTGPPKP